MQRPRLRRGVGGRFAAARGASDEDGCEGGSLCGSACRSRVEANPIGNDMGEKGGPFNKKQEILQIGLNAL